MISVVPAVLARNKSEFDQRIAALRPHFVRAHLDVLDDSLIEGNSFFDPEYVKAIAGSLQFEIHLMVDLTAYDLSVWNAQCVDKIILHAESKGNLDRSLANVRGWGKQAFLALNPDSGLHVVEQHKASIDGIMTMGVTPGRMGASFKADTAERIRALRKQYRDFPLEVDGGISRATIQEILEAGATILAVGSFLENAHMEERLFELITLVEEFEQHNR